MTHGTSPRLSPWWRAALLAAALVLATCGGSGGGSDQVPLPPAVQASAAAPGVADLAKPVSFTHDVPDPQATLAYRWEFGDGQSSNQAQPTHQYAAAGTYRIQLQVSDAEGRSVSSSFTLEVNDLALVQGGLICSEPGERGWCWMQPRPQGLNVRGMRHLEGQTSQAWGGDTGFLVSGNGGVDWTKVHIEPRLVFADLLFADASTGVAVVETPPLYFDRPVSTSALYRTADAGRTWQLALSTVESAEPRSLWRVEDDHLLYSKRSSRIGRFLSRDQGRTWVELPKVELPADCGVLQMAGAFDLWCAEEGGRKLRRSLNAGVTWTEVVVPYPQTWMPRLEALAVSPGGVAAVLAYGNEDLGPRSYELYLTRDGGASWTHTTVESAVPAPVRHFLAVDRAGERVATWCAGGACPPLLSLDAGRSFAAMPLPAGMAPIWEENVEMPAASRLVVRNRSVSVNVNFVSDDNGGTWRRVSPVGTGTRAASVIWFTDRRRGLGVSEAGTLLRTVDGGRQWTEEVLGGSTLAKSASLDARRLCKADAAGRLQVCPLPVVAGAGIRFTRDGALGWMTSRFTLRTSRDGGVTWQASTMGRVLGAHFVDAQRGWLLTHHAEIETAVLLHRTDDGGMTWVDPKPFPAADAMYWGVFASVAFANRDVGVVATTDGVWTTADGGLSWTRRWWRPVMRVEIADPSVIIGIVIPANATWLSRDGGATWVQSGPETGASKVHVFDRDHFVVAGSFGVKSTRDGGTTWSDDLRAPGASDMFFIDRATGWITGPSGTLATVSGGRP